MLNPEEFLSASVEGASSTSIIPIPEGEYQAAIADVTMRHFLYKKADRAGMTGYSLDVNWEINDAAMAEQIKREPKIRQSCLLDLADGKLDMSEGSNISLGRIRDAVGQNDGSPWSPNQLIGSVAIIQVNQRMDGEDIYNDVKKVRKA